MQAIFLSEIECQKSPLEVSQQISAMVHQEGAVILRNVIDGDLARRLRSRLIESLEEDQSRYGPDYLFRGMVHALMHRAQVFLDLLDVPVIHSAMQAILGHGCIVHAYNSSSMPPAGTNFSRSIHVDCPRLIPGYITNVGLTIALDPFTRKNGAMEIAPRLFNRAVPPTEKEFDEAKIVLDSLQIGDAILFNARCWHRGGLNQTSTWRHAVTMNIVRAYMRQQFDFPRMIPANLADSFSENLRQFLGYYVRCPVSMEEFLLPAEQRLYRPGQE